MRVAVAAKIRFKFGVGDRTPSCCARSVSAQRFPSWFRPVGRSRRYGSSIRSAGGRAPGWRAHAA